MPLPLGGRERRAKQKCSCSEAGIRGRPLLSSAELCCLMTLSHNGAERLPDNLDAVYPATLELTYARPSVVVVGVGE